MEREVIIPNAGAVGMIDPMAMPMAVMGGDMYSQGKYQDDRAQTMLHSIGGGTMGAMGALIPVLKKAWAPMPDQKSNKEFS